MSVVGRLGNYLSQGVVLVSSPFHPFGGAVDIIVVEQPDGSYKSSPWYVRFGKFQGVLKAKEKVVKISVNDVEADFNMYLDHKGEAYFIREVEVEEDDSMPPPSSSGDETDGQSQKNRRVLESMSCNYDANKLDSVGQIGGSNGKIVGRTRSRRSRILGFVFGRKSMKEGNFPEESGTSVERVSSLDRAEFAASLLEVKWSTNLSIDKLKNDSFLPLSASAISGSEPDKDIDREKSLLGSSVLENNENSLADHALQDISAAYSEQTREAFQSISGNLDGSIEEVNLEMLCSMQEHAAETSLMIENLLEKSDDREMSRVIDEYTLGDSSCNENSNDFNYKNADDDSQVSCLNVLKPVRLDEHVEMEAVMVDPNNQYQETNSSDLVTQDSDEVNCQEVSKISTRSVDTGLMSEPADEVKSQNILSASSSFDTSHHLQNDDVTRDGNVNFDNQPSIGTSGFVQGKVINNPLSDNSEEEQFLFSDLDESKRRDPECEGLLSPDIDNFSTGGTKEVNGSVSPMHELYLYSGKSSSGKQPNDIESSTESTGDTSSPVNVPGSLVADSEMGPRQAKSMPNMPFQTENLDASDICQPLSHSLNDDTKSKWTLLGENGLSRKDTKAEGGKRFAQKQPNIELEDRSPGDDTSKASRGSWRVWPFSFKRSQSRKAMQADPDGASIHASETASENTNDRDREKEVHTEGEKEVQKPRVVKKFIKEVTPTSEQLASLNLKEGRNMVTFTFSTSMLGQQQVDARIYLWKWNTQIVISDVDGTITKSDVLGQFMPLVGVDWSQTGVTHLFSAIEENGYQMLFLSARSISQAYITRQFLFNLKQDGKVLPDGPVVISPDGLFPSLYREVIRRAPHEFKIACLEKIKALFPPDCNPFYAGFGNRDTDEISYLKVGIPKGKIFTINPKGEVAVNRRVDTKSYTSLHALVNGMFPPMSSAEQEDFNQWNFWKLPPPAIDI